jgi:hypothetical protein
MKLLKYINFLESVLTVDELSKPVVGTQLTKGQKLVDILSKDNPKLTTNKDNIEVPITNSKQVLNKISNKVSNDDGVITYKYSKTKSDKNLKKPNTNRYDNIFQSGKETFRLNDFKKTILFGGEKGAGVNTKVYESVQALFIAYSLRYPNSVDGDEFLRSVIELLESFVNRETALKDILNIYTEGIKIDRELLTSLSLNPDWFATFVKVPEKLYSKNTRGNRVISHSKKYSLYHASYKSDSPVVTLMKKYSDILKENNKSELPEQRWGRINFAKYCPADLYIVETVNIENVKKEIKDASDMNDLTFRLNRLFDSSVFIPVSLKKVGKDKSFDVIVNGERGRKLPEFDIKQFKVTEVPTKGIGSKIETESTWTSVTNNMPDETHVTKIIGFDSSNTSKDINIDGEVEGDFSRHGKISFNIINDILKKTIEENGLPRLNSFSDLSDLKVVNLEKKLADITYKINNKPSKIKVDPSIKGRENIINRKNKLISKLQSLEIIYTFIKLEEINPVIADEKITKIMRYALSIATDKFETPRYLRII